LVNESSPSTRSTSSTAVDPLLSRKEVLPDGSRVSSVPAPNDILACSCILILTSNLTQLNIMSTYHFPRSLHELQIIISHTYAAAACETCQMERVSGMQNVSLILSVLACIVERFRGLSSHIKFEKDRLLATNEKMPMRIGDASFENLHLHTGTDDCPMGINLFIDGNMWAKLALGAVKKAVEGPGTCLKGLMDDFEARQRRWHADPRMKDVMIQNGRDAEGEVALPGGCLHSLGRVRDQLASLDLGS